jgi:outer membrane protein TolC
MKSLSFGIAIICALMSFSGCASVGTEREWARLKINLRERTGQDVNWEQSEAAAAGIREQVEAILAGGLGREEAVQIALLNNRELQSRFEDIGIYKADLIQAGLFRNPRLSAIFRIPYHGGGVNTEIDGILPLSDLWQMPFRKKVASLRLEIGLKRIEQQAVETVWHAGKAYDSVYYLTQAGKDTQALFKQFKDIKGEVVRRRDFGFSRVLDVYLAQVMETEAEMALYRIQSELVVARAHLDRVLGLKPGQSGYELSKGSDREIPAIPDKEQAFGFALEHRPDIQMLRLKIREAEKKLKLEKWRILRELEAGGFYEREVEGDEVFGPGVDIQFPVFDQNQAQIARARFVIQKSKKRLQALKGKIREEIIRDLERIRLGEKRVRLLGDKVIPIREKALQYAGHWVQAMQLNRLHLLEAQKGMLQGRLDYARAQMELHHAVGDLAHHLGGRLPLRKGSH